MSLLTFSTANSKLKKLYKVEELKPWTYRRKIYSLDLLSGWSCPFALECQSRAIETDEGLRVKDGDDCQFRCFSASQEARLENVYKKRKRNFEALRSINSKRIHGILKRNQMLELLRDALPSNAGIVRFHCSGDFFTRMYYRAAIKLAECNPEILFYAYTKAIRFTLEEERPANFIITASRGGTQDSLIDQHNLREAVVVHTVRKAEELGLPIDNDDSHAARPDIQSDSFALLIHGSQPAGTPAAKAVYQLRKGA